MRVIQGLLVVLGLAAAVSTVSAGGPKAKPKAKAKAQ
jgi:hypothetical protein